jgi:ribonucleases P/MRP protein subunit RPP40
MLRIYKALVRPHLEFCTPAWSPLYKDAQLLERVQHRFTRLIPELKNLPYADRLTRLGITTLEERRNRADLLEMFKMYSGLSSLPFSPFSTWTQIIEPVGTQPKSVKIDALLQSDSISSQTEY